MLAMIPKYTNSVSPPFLMIIPHTPGVGWKVKGGGTFSSIPHDLVN